MAWPSQLEFAWPRALSGLLLPSMNEEFIVLKDFMLKPFTMNFQARCWSCQLVTQKLFCPGWNVAVKTGEL